MTNFSPLKVAVLQATSGANPERNLNVFEGLIIEAIKEDIQAVALPECFYAMGDGKSLNPGIVSEVPKTLHQWSKKFNIDILCGTAAYQKEGGRLPFNRDFALDREKGLLDPYDKRKLFACSLVSSSGEKKSIREADTYQAGNESCTRTFSSGLKAGAGICFDMRFSELQLPYRKAAVDVLTFPSAFTVPTGKAHWHTLLRARAIENQCYIIAPAQWGQNAKNVRTFGHSLIVSPWGEVLADAKEGEKFVTATLCPLEIQKMRNSIHMND